MRHELEHRLLAEAVRDDLEPSPLLDKERVVTGTGIGRCLLYTSDAADE